MKIKILLILLTISISSWAQNTTLDWINNNAIHIEDANPNSELVDFKELAPQNFKDAKIFGFGEATHHSKEFFDLKAKFFKYLVEHHNVKTFIMEENYPSEAGINEWISGGEGNKKDIALNFKLAPWRNLEVINLLEWMRNYNLSKPTQDHIHFYGMDIQVVENIETQIRQVVKEYDLPISESKLSIVDKCVSTKINYQNPQEDFVNNTIPILQEIQEIIKTNISNDNNTKRSNAIRAIDFLIDYLDYMKNPHNTVRDFKMFKQAKSIMENNSINGKAFIWAHNEHINNLEFLSYGSGWKNLGFHLKNYYKEKYFSVGFDFGTGTLLGFNIGKDKKAKGQYHKLDKPHKKTYAFKLNEVDYDIYFIDVNQALKSPAKTFFSKKNKVLLTGASGYNPKKPVLISKKYSEMYDGLIFVKKVTPSTTNWKKALLY